MDLPDDPFSQLRRQVEQFQRIADLLDTATVRSVLESVTRLESITSAAAVELERQQSLFRDLGTSPIHAMAEELARLPPWQPPLIAASVPTIDPTLREAVERVSLLTSKATEFAEAVHFKLPTVDVQLQALRAAGAAFQERLLQVERAESPVEQQRALEGVVESLAAWIGNAPNSSAARSVANVLLQIVIAFLVLQVTLGVAKRQAGRAATRDTRFHEEIMDSLASVARSLDELSLQDPVYHRLEAPRPLRAGPSAGAGEIARLPSGSAVEEIDRDGRWLRVVATDSGGRLLVGWIYRRSLLRIEPAAVEAGVSEIADTQSDGGM